MSLINVPRYYENDRGSIKNSGKFIKEICINPLIVGGKTALKSVKKDLYKSLAQNGITYEVNIFTGYPTLEKIDKYSAIISENKNDAIIGVGGGKVMDLVKAIGNKSNVPVITIPTIPATCAAWSALSVIYKDNGEQHIYIHHKHSPELIIADKDILSSAPIRYINSGVADSIVKWYEINPDLRNNRDNFALRLQIKVCELAIEFLKDDYISAYKNGKLNNIKFLRNKSYEELNNKIPESHYIDNDIDSIIMLAGLAGSINGSVPYGGIAHPFYNSSTYIKDTLKCLHGEKVSFGLIVQLILEKRSDEEIYEFIEWMDHLDLPITLKDLGITTDSVSKVSIIAKKTKEWIGDYSGVDYEITVDDIFKAVFEADTKGKNFLMEEVQCRK